MSASPEVRFKFAAARPAGFADLGARPLPNPGQKIDVHMNTANPKQNFISFHSSVEKAAGRAMDHVGIEIACMASEGLSVEDSDAFFATRVERRLPKVNP